MPTQMTIRVKLNAGLPTVSQTGADRVHILNGEVAYGPTAIIGKPTRMVFTDAELLAFSVQLRSYLKQKGISDVPRHDPTEQSLSGVHPSGSGG